MKPSFMPIADLFCVSFGFFLTGVGLNYYTWRELEIELQMKFPIGPIKKPIGLYFSIPGISIM